ncbi:helix-turn-helix transcriptional regulator [Frankia sp. R82]|uniref:helix-turn-helix transcriptional regulator n=1 Tax=Frankia sp. R82 TaxID=2950553 RepID=UPI0020449104|nr:helix-turn-helix transcriptional regulator [Frankia sp. R82]MCM3883040.1 helix-turn-helix transcriptional regulator [Frankia sp. R82]
MTHPRTTRRPELARFLRAKRARLRPQDVGLPCGDRRRAPGLRRQEVAQLAAVSVDWYIRLEQGRVGIPGAEVLDAVARALLLSPAERRHLHLIGRDEAPIDAAVPTPVSDSLLALLDGMPLVPAYLMDFRCDILARNAAAAALFGETFGLGDAANNAYLLFLDPRTRKTQLDWTRIAREAVGNLRADFARHRDDARLAEVIARLRRDSAEFAAWWDDHTVQERSHGVKRICHPVAGELTVAYDLLATLDGSHQRLFAVTPADAATDRALRGLITDRARTMTGRSSRAIQDAAATAPLAPASTSPLD